MNYLLWNKASDYLRGHLENLAVDGRKLKLMDCNARKPGLFFSRRMDSKEAETKWHRLIMDVVIGENMAVYLSLYATDEAAKARQIDELFEQGESSLGEKMSRMEALKQLEVRNPEDILLHQVQGRYLWVGAAIWGNGTGSPIIHMLQIYFPQESWNRYLPEIYQGKEQQFLTQYLAIFQSLYQDLEQQIRKDTHWLDFQKTDREALQWLASWIHVENSHLWPEECLRRYLRNGASLFGLRGTARGLLRVVEIFTGETPYLMEAGTGEDPHRFTMFIREAAVASARSYRALLQVIQEGKPADMDICLVPLRAFVILDNNTYLGINSQLNQYQDTVLGDEAALGFVRLGGME